MIIFLITVGIAAFISMFSYKKRNLNKNVETKKDVEKLDDFICKNAITKNDIYSKI